MLDAEPHAQAGGGKRFSETGDMWKIGRDIVDVDPLLIGASTTVLILAGAAGHFALTVLVGVGRM